MEPTGPGAVPTKVKEHTFDKMIRFIAFLLGLATASLATTVNASLRGNHDQVEPLDVGFPYAETVRSLIATDFVPLSCNNHIADCTPWTAKFGTKKIHTRRLIIDCGECVLMDHPGPMLTLLAGVDIRGKLQILRNKSDSALIINSTMVSVQGVLEMSVTKAVDGKPLITFVLEGNDEQSFTPIRENSEACGGNPCIIGKKAITVAGGKVDSKCSRLCVPNNVISIDPNTYQYQSLSHQSMDCHLIHRHGCLCTT